MFGCIVSGRLVQTNLRQIDATKYVFELHDAEKINHIVVFLLGTQPLQPGYAATVHLLWPNRDWQLLRMISNEKPSAIFKLQHPWQNAANSDAQTGMTAELGISIEPLEVAQQSVIASKSTKLATNVPAAANSEASSQNLVTLSGGLQSMSNNSQGQLEQLARTFAQNALVNLHEYVGSYAKPYAESINAAGLHQLLLQLQSMIPPEQFQPLSAWVQGEVIPAKAFEEWYEGFMRKIKLDPSWGFKSQAI